MVMAQEQQVSQTEPPRLQEIMHTTRQLVSRVGLAIGLLIGPNIVDSIDANPALAESVVIADYPNQDAKPYNTSAWEWWVDEDGNGKPYIVNDNFKTNDERMSSRGYYYRNCTDGASFWVNTYVSVNPSGLGNASNWDDSAKGKYTVLDGKSDVNKIEPGDVAQSDTAASGYGHVEFVTNVTKNDADEVASFSTIAMNHNGDGLQKTWTYSAKDTNGKFIEAGSDKWDHFIDFNGLGKGINGDVVATKAQPEQSGPYDPMGRIENIRRTPGGIHVDGWVFDQDQTDKAIDFDLYGGDGYVKQENFRGRATANYYRPDVGNTLHINPYHGIYADFPMDDKQHRLCIYGLNVNAGQTRRNDCVDYNISGTAIGNFEQMFRIPGGARLIGWGIDPDTDGPIDMRFYESENPDPNYFRGGATANKSRPDVINGLAAAYIGFSPSHGLDYNLPLSYGPHRPCAFAVNKDGTPGESQGLGCKDINISPEPYGIFEGANRVSGGIALRGWAIDPDIAGSVDIHVYRTDTSGHTYFVGGFPANQSRRDILSNNPGYDEFHGFNNTLSLPAGTQRVCAFVLNAANTAGNNQSMGCITVN